MTSDPERQYLDLLAATVAARGHAVQGVGGAGVVPWAYTIGLWPTCPELLVTGIDARAITPVLNHAAAECRSGAVETGTLINGLADGYALMFLPIPDAAADPHFAAARRYHDGPFEAWQLVWPDTDGRFPWQDRYNPRMRQPLVGTPPS